MRVPNVAFYTLATLAAADFTQIAIASSTPTLLDDNPPASAESIHPTLSVAEPINSVTPPEAFITAFPSLELRPAAASEKLISAEVPLDLTLMPTVLDQGLISEPNRFEIAPPEGLAMLERTRVPERSLDARFTAAVSAPDGLTSAIATTESPSTPSLETANVAPVLTEKETDLVETTLEEPPQIASAGDRLAPESSESENSESEGVMVSSAALLSNPSTLVAQATPPLEAQIEDLQQQLESLEPDLADDYGNEFEGSPAVTISNPSGFGADNFTGFLNFGFQAETRYSNQADGSMGIGIGLGDAQRAVGLQLSYTLASFGGSRDFGAGGFNAKLHRQFSNGLGIAIGWEGFLTTDDLVDFEDTVYGSITQIIRTNDDLSDPFSRIALTAGIGNGRFRSEEAVTDDEETVGVFGSVAVRVARPVSAIVEWTGQDLAVGLSITPIQGFPLVITPALRDIAGAGDGARFVLGTGISFQF